MSREVVYVSYLPQDYSRSAVHLNFEKYKGENRYRFVKIDGTIVIKILLIFRLVKQHKFRNTIYVVMSPSHFISVIIRILSLRSKIILDAGWPLVDSAELKNVSKLRLKLVWLTDFLSFHMSNIIVLESNNQREYVRKKFLVNTKKLVVNFTGFDEEAIRNQTSNAKRKFQRNKKYLLFRGRFNSESGLEFILEIMKSLPKKYELIVVTDEKFKAAITQDNVKIYNEYIEWEELYKIYSNCTLAFGQISQIERLKRTVPHKFFEAMYFNTVYVSRELYPLSEIMIDGHNYYVLKASNSMQASIEIKKLLNDETKLRKLRSNAQTTYNEYFSQKIIHDKMKAFIFNFD